MNEKIEQIKIKLTKGLLSLNFSQDQSEKQIQYLGEVITQSILMRVTKEHLNQKNEILNDFEKFIQSNYSDVEFNTIVEEESSKIVNEYIDEITSNLDQTKRNDFISSLTL